MPETMSPNQEDQGSEKSLRGENTLEMSTDMNALLEEKKHLEQELAVAESADDKVTVDSVRFRLSSVEAQMDEVSRQKEQKLD